MRKLIYYFRVILFISYLVIAFFMIDDLYDGGLLVNLYFLLNIIYAFLIILSMLSKKKIFQNSLSFNILNIGFYIYTYIIYFIVNDFTRLEITKNFVYFRNNYLLISLLLIGLLFYIITLNVDAKKDD